MDWFWHVVLFAFLWGVMADTFYKDYSFPTSFVCTVMIYPVVYIVAQLLQ